MKLRFEVDQAEAFRRGVDCPNSIIILDVDPATLSQEVRNKIADRLSGIDVVATEMCGGKRFKSAKKIKTTLPTFESLMEAVDNDEKNPVDRDAFMKRIAEVGAQALQVAKDGLKDLS